MKEFRTMVELLSWAYADQCVDRMQQAALHCAPSSSPVNAIASYMALGTRVDAASFASRNAGVRLPSDALIIHDAVLALPERYIQIKDDVDIALWCMTRAKARGAQIKIDNGSALLEFEGQTHTLTSASVVPLIVCHAKTRTTPDWHENWKRKAGNPKHATKGDRGRLKGYKLDYVPSYDEVIFDRAIYCAWCDALDALCKELCGLLSKFEIKESGVAPSPWLQPHVERRVIHI